MKVKNITVMVLLFFVTTAVGCDNSNPPTIDNRVQYIHAKVENASEFNNVVEVKLMVFDRYDIVITSSIERYVELVRGDWKNGSFTIELPKMLDPSHLRPLVGGIGANRPTNIAFAQRTMDINNRNVRIVDAHFVGIDKDGNIIAVFSLSNRNGGYAGTEVLFTYVDSDVTISGHTRREGHVMSVPGGPTWFEEITNYSINWEKGWNVWYYLKSSTVTDRIWIRTNQWSTTPISGLKWHGSKENLWKFQN